MRKLKFLLVLFLFVPLSCFAEQINLDCSNAKDFSMVFSVDTAKNEVLFNGVSAVGVFIDVNTIEFSIDNGSDDWYFKINRLSGQLSFEDMKTNKVIPGIICEKSKNK